MAVDDAALMEFIGQVTDPEWFHVKAAVCDSGKLLFQQNKQSTAPSAQAVCGFSCLLRFVPARLKHNRDPKKGCPERSTWLQQQLMGKR